MEENEKENGYCVLHVLGTVAFARVCSFGKKRQKCGLQAKV